MAMRHSLASTLLSLSLYLLLVTVTPSAAVVTTRTIDDTNGDSVTGAVPVYNPADQFSLNSNCPGCVYHPDPGGAFDQTWHDTAQLNGAGAMTVSFAFTGTSVSLFCTLVTKQLTSTPVGSTYLALSIDGVSHGTYTHVPASTGDTAGFAYKQKVFEVDGLANIAHNVVLSTNNPQGSYMLFDYASYTFDDGVTPQPPPPPSRTTTTVTNVLVSTSTGTGTTQTTTSTTTASDTRTIGTTGTNNSGTTSPSPGHSSSSSSSSLSSSPPTSSLADSGSVAVTGPSSKKSVNVAAIAAASVGGVLCILLAILIVVLCRRRQRQRHPDSTMQQAQAHPLALALPIHTDYPTDYPAQVRVGHGVDAEPALVPELHYGRAGVGDPEKAALRQSLFDLGAGANGSRPRLAHQASIATFATGSSLTVGSGSGRGRGGGGGSQSGSGRGPDEEDLTLEYDDTNTNSGSGANTALTRSPSLLSRAPTFRTLDYNSYYDPHPYPHPHPYPPQSSPDPLPLPNSPPPGYDHSESQSLSLSGFRHQQQQQYWHESESESQPPMAMPSQRTFASD